MIMIEKKNRFNCSNYPCENKVNRLIKIGNKQNNQMIILCDDCLHSLSNKINISILADTIKLREVE
jgi:hypothetical protein